MKMMYTTVVLTMKLMSEKYRKQMCLGRLQTSNEHGRGGLGDLEDWGRLGKLGDWGGLGGLGDWGEVADLHGLDELGGLGGIQDWAN